jgi:hypothetical protein
MNVETYLESYQRLYWKHVDKDREMKHGYEDYSLLGHSAQHQDPDDGHSARL